MFGRVSTVPLSEYLAKEDFAFNGNGVYLAKKFNGEYVKYGLSVYRPKVSGWVDVDEDTGERSYPDTALPPELPPWVVAKEYNYYSQTIQNAQRFILDAYASLGPYTLQEALYIYSVLRAYNAVGLDQTLTMSGAGFSKDVPLGPANNVFTYSPEFEPDITDPNDLFTPSLKGRKVSYFANSSSQDNYDEDDNGSALYTDAEVFLGGGYGSYGDAQFTIVVDVDKLSDFYISFENFSGSQSFTDSVYYGYATAAASTNDSGTEENPGGSAGKSIIATVYVSIDKFKTEFNGTELSNDGDEASKTEVDYSGTTTVTDVKYFETEVTFEFGSITKIVKGYGLETVSTTTYAYGESPPPTPNTKVTGLRPTSIVLKGDKYWPYKNAQGEPVYNETTGAKLADPVP
jgi:hypothetical protein